MHERLKETPKAAVKKELQVQDGAVMFKVLAPMRDGPVVQVGPGDLAQPYVRSLWARFTGVFTAAIEVMRDARALEERLVAERGFRGIRES